MEYNEDLAKQHRPVYCWGHKRLPNQRGITSHTVSPNRLRPLAHAGHNAIFNTFRRSKNQVLYVAPPFLLAYLVMKWAEERNEFLNSKPGRVVLCDD